MTHELQDMAPAAWMTEGACNDEDPELFFPISASEASAEQIQRATAVCAGCGVKAQCLHYALANTIKDGIWGGRTEQQRQSLTRSRRKKRLKLRGGRRAPSTRTFR
ncbi:WhiB family transcriptional regulator [Actinomadura sp. DC4]|uniref:WhiB family transcriptional regulator n=1 Tax=Actinomadura sp. DC4 TaxID=3055069 RepID=UPI0025AEEAE2|nr:WhiB family transcriptional regulator [Actinomadura sp. DC4]MDN3354059.1 WhiB family transcriptional regulator [Actinomadura sp. DC4]